MSRRLNAALGTGILGVIVLSGVCTCSDDMVPATSSDAGAADAIATDVTGDDEVGDPWDPVWHETEPKQWPTVGDATVTECDEGCRVGLHIPELNPGYYGQASSKAGLVGVNTDTHHLFYAPIAATKTFLLGEGDEDTRNFVEPYFHEAFLSYLRIMHKEKSRTIEVMNVVTGERKVAYSYQLTGDQMDVILTAHNSKHVFWMAAGGIKSRNLETGEMRLLSRRECDAMCATTSDLLCFASPIVSLDIATTTEKVLNSGGALQTDGACSPGKNLAIWIDYRDPPGTDSGWFAPRNGGEVYVMDLSTRELRRLTHDSPAAPRAKGYPAIGDELAAWKEVPEQFDPNPPTRQDLYASIWDLVVLDLNTGHKCKIQSELTKYFTFMSVHGRWVYGKAPTGYIIGVDVDHPAIGCVPYGGSSE